MLPMSPKYIDAINADRRHRAEQHRRAKMVIAARRRNEQRPETAHRLGLMQRFVAAVDRR